MKLFFPTAAVALHEGCGGNFIGALFFGPFFTVCVPRHHSTRSCSESSGGRCCWNPKPHAVWQNLEQPRWPDGQPSELAFELPLPMCTPEMQEMLETRMKVSIEDVASSEIPVQPQEMHWRDVTGWQALSQDSEMQMLALFAPSGADSEGQSVEAAHWEWLTWLTRETPAVSRIRWV